MSENEQTTSHKNRAMQAITTSDDPEKNAASENGQSASDKKRAKRIIVALGGTGAVIALILAAIQIVQATISSKDQASVDATAIAIQEAQLNVMKEAATLQSMNLSNDATATVVAARLVQLHETSIALQIAELENTITALEKEKKTLSAPKPASTPTFTPVPPTPRVLPQSPTPKPTTMLKSVELRIESTLERNKTNLEIHQGQLIKIEYITGRWRAGPLPTWPWYGPNGDPQVPSKETFPVKDKPIMGLVAGIGDSQPFWVGQWIQFESAASGELWLGANDDHFDDNDGSLTVMVSIYD